MLCICVTPTKTIKLEHPGKLGNNCQGSTQQPDSTIETKHFQVLKSCIQCAMEQNLLSFLRDLIKGPQKSNDRMKLCLDRIYSCNLISFMYIYMFALTRYNIYDRNRCRHERWEAGLRSLALASGPCDRRHAHRHCHQRPPSVCATVARYEWSLYEQRSEA